MYNYVFMQPWIAILLRKLFRRIHRSLPTDLYTVLSLTLVSLVTGLLGTNLRPQFSAQSKASGSLRTFSANVSTLRHCHTIENFRKLSNKIFYSSIIDAIFAFTFNDVNTYWLKFSQKNFGKFWIVQHEMHQL